jgi:hypothetical protein
VLKLSVNTQQSQTKLSKGVTQTQNQDKPINAVTFMPTYPNPNSKLLPPPELFCSGTEEPMHAFASRIHPRNIHFG